MRRLYVLRGRPHRRERTYKPTRLFRYTADRIGCDSGWTRFLWSGFRSRQGLYQKVVHPVRSENSPLRRRRDEPLLPAEGNRSAFRPSQGRLATALGFGRMFQTTAERPIPGLGCCPLTSHSIHRHCNEQHYPNDIVLYLFVYHSLFGRRTVVTTSALAALAETRHCLMSTH